VYKYVPPDEFATGPDELMAEIAAIVSPTTWAEAGGAGTMSYHGLSGSLVVNQSPRVHRQIARHYGNLLKPVILPAEGTYDVPGMDLPVNALAAPTDLDVEKTPLVEVVASLAKRHGIEIALDDSLSSHDIDPESPIRAHARAVPLAVVLDVILEPLGLTWAGERSGIRILPRDVAEGAPAIATHDARGAVIVGDLFTHQQLPKLIVATIAPISWESNGGLGAIRLRRDGTLVVRNGRAEQQRVAWLLDGLAAAYRMKGATLGYTPAAAPWSNQGADSGLPADPKTGLRQPGAGLQGGGSDGDPGGGRPGSGRSGNAPLLGKPSGGVEKVDPADNSERAVR
jgi:hypothetical protein